MTSQTDDEVTRAPRRIFVLGDSRTGTMTLHRFFEALGLKSIHWFVKQSGQVTPAYEHFAANWERCREFVRSSGFEAFSDYPTRTFFRELMQEFPDAYFILSSRRDLQTWQKSMHGFFSKFDINLDLPKLSESYLKLNEDIRALAATANLRFIEICIDDDADQNSDRLKAFLGIESPNAMGWENRTASYENKITSRRAQFFNTTTEDVIGYIEALCRGSKAMPSERGWLFMVNDANDFLRYQFGQKQLTPAETARAADCVRERAAVLRSKGIAFLNVIVPEKSVVYRSYLPTALDRLVQSEKRPAPQLAAEVPETVQYLNDYLTDASSYGTVYFRGDTHTNWLGSFFVYHYIIEQVGRSLQTSRRAPRGALVPPLTLAALSSRLVDYNGDLHELLLTKHADEYANVWRFVRSGQAFERVAYYGLPEQRISTQVVPAPSELAFLGDSRPLIIREHSRTDLPRAVIFRDSIADHIIELLAEHFSRSVFVWHKGLVIDDIIESENPDVVIHMSAERFVWMYSRQAPFSNLAFARQMASVATPAIPNGAAVAGNAPA